MCVYEENIAAFVKPIEKEEINGSILHLNLERIVKIANYKIIFKIAQNIVNIVESVVISLTIVSSRNELINNVFLQEKVIKKNETEVNNICPHLNLHSNILHLITSFESFSRLLHSAFNYFAVHYILSCQ